MATDTAEAQSSVFWKTVGNWDISIDTTIDDGCYALASWNGGTVLRIGINPSADNYYVLIGNDKWASLQNEVDYDIQIQFGSRASWDVAARGLQFAPGETVYLHAQSTKMDFVSEFQRALNMKISYNGNEIDNLKLTGSSRAWNEVVACQNEVDRRGATNLEDPFATTNRPSLDGRKAADPFAD